MKLIFILLQCRSGNVNIFLKWYFNRCVKGIFNKTIHVINNYIFAPKYYQESMETLFLFQKRNFIQETYIYILFCSECMLFGISDQISCSVVSDSLQPHELQHLSPPCPSPTPGVHSYSRPSSQ